jgi:L-fuconolactonase
VFCKLPGLVKKADLQNWTSNQVTPYPDVAFEAFGADRLMIGSDWPVCLVAGSYGRTVGVVKDYVRQQKAEWRDAILGGNAQRLLETGDGRKDRQVIRASRVVSLRWLLL